MSKRGLRQPQGQPAHLWAPLQWKPDPRGAWFFGEHGTSVWPSWPTPSEVRHAPLHHLADAQGTVGCWLPAHVEGNGL